MGWGNANPNPNPKLTVGQVAAGERSTARDEAQRDGQEVAVAPRAILLLEGRAW